MKQILLTLLFTLPTSAVALQSAAAAADRPNVIVIFIDACDRFT